MTVSLRLAKRLAEMESCSRSEAEQYIQGGWVTVDGLVVEEPGFRVQDQKIELSPHASLATVESITILLHKPAGIDTFADPSASIHLITADRLAADDRSGNRFLKRHLTNLTQTDHLETNTSGLQVLTQDWRIARKLIDDAAKIDYTKQLADMLRKMAQGKSVLMAGAGQGFCALGSGQETRDLPSAEWAGSENQSSATRPARASNTHRNQTSPRGRAGCPPAVVADRPISDCGHACMFQGLTVLRRTGRAHR